MAINWLPETFRTIGNGHKFKSGDVRITSFTVANGSDAIRLGFIGNAGDAFKNATYIEISSPLDDAERLYFRLLDSRKFNSNKLQHGAFSSYVTFYDSRLIDAYKKYWIGNAFEIHFDSAEGYYYIERGDQ